MKVDSATAPTEDEWTFAMPVDELWEGEVVGVRIAGVEVLLANLGRGEIVAYDERCPHAGARLSEGRFHAGVLQCASHLWEFDLATGDGVNPRSCKLRKYAVKLVDGAVLVRVDR